LEVEVTRLKEIHQRGCDCSPDDACRFARERDEARAKAKELEAALRSCFRFDMGSYNGPDYPKNATRARWYVRSTESVEQDGNQPPLDIVEAVLKMHAEKLPGGSRPEDRPVCGLVKQVLE